MTLKKLQFLAGLAGLGTSVSLASAAPVLLGIPTYSSLALDVPVYAINPVNAHATALATITGYNRPGFGGAEYLSGKLYGSNISQNQFLPLAVAEVNPVTGGTTLVSNQSGLINWQGLAGDEADGLLYSVDVFTQRLYSLNPANGAVVDVGLVGWGVSGLAYDQNNRILYGVSQTGHFVSINTGTGATTLIGDIINTPNPIALYGLAYDNDTATFYMTIADEAFLPTRLYKFTLASAMSPEFIGTVLLDGATPVLGITGLALNPVPAPGGAAVILGAGLFLAPRRRRSAW